MGKQVHFVICVDTDEEKMWIDDETYTSRFDGAEQVWNTETNEWEEDTEMAVYNKALKLLNERSLERD